ncbi:hypothetical protein P350_21000 [Burkholderia cepacia JBK9]|uniref:hypothetical protein n=1 Tax=Burkholderia arboris TaxID=488730 RepID=UPI0004D4C11E|nr:hypothetical protein [Burkholderia arboris]ALX14069.1 hypothetical protein P350_21000 [Burkholderia cepacia JBK9]MCA8495092.1 hypothetical protein [Burkholderia arboris]
MKNDDKPSVGMAQSGADGPKDDHTGGASFRRIRFPEGNSVFEGLNSLQVLVSESGSMSGNIREIGRVEIRDLSQVMRQ